MTTEHAMNMLTAAEQALALIPLPPSAGALPPGASPVQWEEFDGSSATTTVGRSNALNKGAVTLRIELGRARIHRDELSRLRTGSVVPLDNAANDSVAMYADGQLIARGELLTIDGRFGVRVVELFSPFGENYSVSGQR